MEWRSESQTDWNAWLRAALLLALTAFLGRLILTGEIKWYVNPKFTTFTASAGVGLVLMAAGQINRALKRRPGDAPVRMRLYLAVAAVVGLGFGLRPVVFASDLAAKQGLNITKRASSKADVAAVAPPVAQPAPAPAPAEGSKAVPTETPPGPAGATQPGTSQPTAAATSGPTAPTATAPAAKAPAGDVITITPDNFVEWMTRFYGPNPDEYAGRRVRYEGFIFYPPDVKPDEFAVTRLVVTCHVAHAYPDGLLTVWPGHSKPEQDTWMRVEGVLEPVFHMGVNTLRIKADRLVAASQPSDPYVYP